jgi:beta-lactamase regulating signal transducer with metallopeptidase domain
VQIAELAGWALLHSVWQGAVVALVLWGVLRVIRPAAPRLRYGAGLAALAVLLVLPVLNYRQSVGLREGHRAWLVQEARHIVTDQLSVAGSAEPRAVTEELRRRHATVWLADSPVAGAVRAARGPVRAFAWLWLGGVLVLGLRLCARCRRVGRLGDGGRRDPRWADAADRMAARIGLRRRVRIRVTRRVDVPALVGWRWPVVLVPPSAVGLPDGEVEAILAHELAHVVRHDYLVNVLQSVAEVLLFFSPAAWWISRQIREERECSCDQSAIGVVDGGPVRYVGALLALETVRPELTGALALHGGPLVRRVRRIHARSRDRRVVDWRSAAAMILVGGAAALAVPGPDHEPSLAARVSTAGLMLQDLDGMRLVVVTAVPAPVDPGECPERRAVVQEA